MALFGKRAQERVAAPEPLFDEHFQRKLEGLALSSRRLASGRERAERKTNRSESGVEFAEHRAYVPGDDFRFLDWKVFARSDRLLVKQFQEEADLSVRAATLLRKSFNVAQGADIRVEKRTPAGGGGTSSAATSSARGSSSTWARRSRSTARTRSATTA